MSLKPRNRSVRTDIIRNKHLIKRPKGRRSILIFVMAAILLMALCFLIWGGENERKIKTPSGNVTIPNWITQDLLPVNGYSRPGTPLTQVNGVVVHYTGNPGTTAEQNRNYFSNLAVTHKTKSSSHFIIGIEGKIIQCVPLDEISYCSNDRNGDTIAVECCHPDETGKFTDETYASLVRLVQWLCKTYQLKSGQVIRHYDITGKKCPLYFVDHEDAWKTFLTDIEKGY